MGGSMGENIVVMDEANKAQAQLLRMLCSLFRMSPDELSRLGERLCALEGVDARCDQIARLVNKTCCVGQVMFSQLTLDDQSDKNKTSMSEIVKDFGPDFVNSYAIPPGKSMRLTHAARPGFMPSTISLDVSLANNGNNYLDIRVQFYVVPANGASALGKPIGPVYEGFEFLEKDGRLKQVRFPTYRNEPIIIGSAERLAATITHSGGVNAINSASLSVYYDNQAFYAGCCSSCGRGETCSCSARPPKQLPPVG